MLEPSGVDYGEFMNEVNKAVSTDGFKCVHENTGWCGYCITTPNGTKCQLVKNNERYVLCEYTAAPFTTGPSLKLEFESLDECKAYLLETERGGIVVSKAEYHELCLDEYPPQVYFKYPYDIEGREVKELCLTCFSETDFKLESIHPTETTFDGYEISDWIEVTGSYGKELYEQLPSGTKSMIRIAVTSQSVTHLHPKYATALIWTFFVLDFDLTYDSDGGDDDVFPECYLVPEERFAEVKDIAIEAGRTYADLPSGDFSVADIFTIMLNESKIPWQKVGNIEIPFENRRTTYLSTSISREVV